MHGGALQWDAPRLLTARFCGNHEASTQTFVQRESTDTKTFPCKQRDSSCRVLRVVAQPLPPAYSLYSTKHLGKESQGCWEQAQLTEGSALLNSNGVNCVQERT